MAGPLEARRGAVRCSSVLRMMAPVGEFIIQAGSPGGAGAGGGGGGGATFWGSGIFGLETHMGYLAMERRTFWRVTR